MHSSIAVRTSNTTSARSRSFRAIGRNVHVLVGRGATGALPVAVTALASRAYGLEVMGGLAAALMLAYGTAEVADGLSQRYVARQLARSPRVDVLAAFNGLRTLILCTGLLASSAILWLAIRDVQLWHLMVLTTAIWSTLANLFYAITLAREDYTSVTVGPLIALAGLVGSAWVLDITAPQWGALNLAVALTAGRLSEIVWLRYRQEWPGWRFDLESLSTEWRASRYLLAQALLSSLHVRLLIPLVAAIAGATAAGVFSIGFNLLSLISLTAVAFSVPAYHRAVSEGPVITLTAGWHRTRYDFVLSATVCSGLVLLLWATAPWLVARVFDVYEGHVYEVARIVLLGGLFETLAIFATLWYHATYRDREVMLLSTFGTAAGWASLAIGYAVGGLPGMAWGFVLSRVGAVLLLYHKAWTPLLVRARTRADRSDRADFSAESATELPRDCRIRVLRIIARLNVGGPAIHVALLHERLDPLRYESIVVTGTEGPSEGNYLDLHGRPLANLVKFEGLGREIRGVSDLKTLFALVRLMRRYRPAIVHTHTAKAGTVGRVAAWLCRVPVVVHTFHGHVFQGYFSRAKTRVFVAIERGLARRSNCLIAVSDRVRQDLLSLGIGRDEQYRTIPLGFDLRPFLEAAAHRGALRAELALSTEAPLVGIVARLVPIKAHELFLEAAAHVRVQRPDVTFLIVGDGERRQALEMLTARLGLVDSVRFLGWRADLERIYADLDVVALTSQNEGSPVALIEAMAASRAVVATAVGGVPDVVEDGRTGLLVSPQDAAALSNAMLRLLDDVSLRVRLGGAAQESVRHRYHIDRLLQDIDDLYSSLLSSDKPVSGAIIASGDQGSPDADCPRSNVTAAYVPQRTRKVPDR